MLCGDCRELSCNASLNEGRHTSSRGAYFGEEEEEEEEEEERATVNISESFVSKPPSRHESTV